MTHLINTGNSTIIDLLQKHAEQIPNQKAFTFLDNYSNNSLTYFELDNKIEKIALYLQSLNIKGERALLLYPPGFDYIIGYFACLYAGIIAVPVYPPDPNRLRKTLPRILSIIKDCDAKIALSTTQILNDINNWEDLPSIKNDRINEQDNRNLAEFERISNLKWIVTDNLDKEINSDTIHHTVKPEEIAYLQYTSGSTGVPKGVIITHENIIHNLQMIKNGFELFEDNYEGVIWLPIYHDMGLVGGILEPIFCGFHSTLMSPLDFLKRPLKWLQVISDIPKDKKVVSGGPNFAYELCSRATNLEKSKLFNLNNWVLAFSGAEPVRADTLEKFFESFKVSGFRKEAFYPCYGLAEGTLIVSGVERQKSPIKILIDKEFLKKSEIKVCNQKSESTVEFVSSGREIIDCSIKIVNPNTRELCSENRIGEIWTSSKSVAHGYWEKTEITKEIFNAKILGNDEQMFLRTGDLGFINDGNLFVTGRLKDLIIIRGSNHYPQDIEYTVENSNNLLRPSSNAAFSIDVDDEEKLVIVQEARDKQNVDWNNVSKDIFNAVLNIHDIAAHSIVLIKPQTIFKTSSGKIQRNATKSAYLDNKLEIIYEWKYGNHFEKPKTRESDFEIDNYLEGDKNDKQKYISLLIDEISREIGIDKNKINIYEPFVNYGLDSAKAVRLVGKFEDTFNKKLEATLFWTYPNIDKLAEFLMESSNNNKEEIEINDNKEIDDFTQKVENMSEEEAEKFLINQIRDINK